MKPLIRLLMVAVFALAMAWVEAAVVLDLRTLIGRLDPYQPDPLPGFGGLGTAEMIREAATLTMLLMVGLLAGESGRGRIGYAAFAFGVWDIAYYLFLIPLTGWPRSLLDWDILFLLPLPWWGPVAAPVAISLLLMAGGGAAAWSDGEGRPAAPGVHPLLFGLAGAGLALVCFMRSAILALPEGSRAVAQTLPETFAWPAFLFAWVLMAVPVLELWRQAAGLKPMFRDRKDRVEATRFPEGKGISPAASSFPPSRSHG